MELKGTDILRATKGRLLAGSRDAVVSAMIIDSRAAAGGSFFVPLQGVHADGHTYIEAALRAGACGSFVRKGHETAQRISSLYGDKVIIEVADPLQALGDTASFWRNRFSPRVVAITGSNGKTSTKEMAWNILGPRCACMKNPGNFNNLIGLPLSLFQLDGTHDVAILEMGMSERGEIRRLAEISSPGIGLITNIGPSHLEQLKTLDEITAAKAELFEALGENDTAIVNNDDTRVAALRRRTRARCVSFGLSAGDVHASSIGTGNYCDAAFELHAGGQSLPVQLKIPGRQFVSNALAAAAIAWSLGIDLQHIKEGLESFTGVPGRMETVDLGRVRIINDAYNANPVSMKAALTALSSLSRCNRTVAVLGDMLELGEGSELFHRQLGETAAELHIDYLFVTGDFAASVREGAQAAGMEKNAIFICSGIEDIAGMLREKLRDGDAVLLKGSRKMKMERILELLRQNGEGERASG